MKVNVDWTGKVSFRGENEAGNRVQMDGPAEKGGENRGPRPMELVLMGMGGCSSYDVMSMLEKGRQDVSACRAEITAERADAVPAVFTKIHLSFHVTGSNLKESLVKRAVNLSAEKYCSVSIMLQKGGVEVTHDYVIHEAE